MPAAPRVLVLGAGGMLGRYVVGALAQRGCDVAPSTRSRFDPLCDPWTAHAWDRYDAVVNAMGVVPQKSVAPRDLYVVNAALPRYAAGRARRWVQVSTDCVFSGRRGGYRVEDAPDPVDDYGRSKLLGEVGLVVRGSFVGEGEPRALLETVRTRSDMPGYVDHYWNGTSALEFARVVARLVTDDDRTSGITHVAGPEVVTKLKLCALIADVYGHPLALRPVAAGYVDRTLAPTYRVWTPLRAQLVEQRGWL